MEANVCGKPVIVTDMDPVNEFMKDNVNALLVPSFLGKSQNVICDVNEISVEDLASKMEMCKNELILKTLKNNARIFAESNFNWKKNNIHFKKLFINKEELQ